MYSQYDQGLDCGLLGYPREEGVRFIWNAGNSVQGRTLVVASYYSDSLRAGLSGDRIPVGARFSAPVQTCPGAHPASCTMGTGSFPGVNDRGLALTTHPI